MAKIRVGQGLFKRGFLEALKQANQRDVLLVDEGIYELEPIFVNNLSIVGVGDPSKTILRTRVEARGRSKISNLTVEAPPFHNAISLKTPNAHLQLYQCSIYGEPTWKYPAVFSKNGTVVMRQSTVHSDKASNGMCFESGSHLDAEASDTARLYLSGSRALLKNVSGYVIQCVDRSTVDSQGSLRLSPAKGKRLLVIEGESVFRADQVRWDDENDEALCSASYMQLSQPLPSHGHKLKVVKKGGGRVEASNDVVSVVDKDLPAEPQPAEPKVVMWRLQDAESFSTAVAPQLGPSDTVLLEEGDYFLEDYGNFLTLGANISGKGRAEHTIIHGGLGVMEGREISVSNLTLRPRSETNGFNVRAGGNALLTNVIIDTHPEAQFPAVYLDSGSATMAGCHVLTQADNETIGKVVVDHGAEGLHASGSNLGWLRVLGGAAVSVSDCSCFQIWVSDQAAVNTEGQLRLHANFANQRKLVAQTGGSIHSEAVCLDADECEAFVEDSRLNINLLEKSDQAVVTIMHNANSSVEVHGAPVRYIDVDSPAEDEGDTPRMVVAEPQAEASIPQTEAGDDEPHSDPEASSDELDEDAPENGPGEPAEIVDPLAEIRALTGLATVKKQIQSFTDMVKFNMLRRQGNLKTTETTMHSMFLGNPGTGKTTVARLLGKALYEAGAVEREHFVEVGRQHLVGEALGASARLTQQVLEGARGGVLFIDEAYSLYQENNNEFAQEAVDTLITFMENHRDEIVVIFAGYADQMQNFLAMNPGLKSRVPNRFDFEDYTPGEIADIGYQSLLGDDYSADEELYRTVVSRKYARSSDRSNGRWVRNFNQELVQEMARRVLNATNHAPEDLSRITEEDLYQLAGGHSEQKDLAVQQLLRELDELIGLAPVKDWVRRLVNRVKVDRQRLELDGETLRPTYHMVFAGNPGTGKTTVARLVSQLFHYLGILENPTVKVVDRSKLVGRWIGQTEEITTRAIDEAMGGVLFVDEAYQLSVESSANDFGKQAIETFMTRLEDDRDKFVAIFAGYTEEMESFLDMNPGLSSRVPTTVEFPDYSPEEVAQIVVNQLAKRWEFNHEVLFEVAAANYGAAQEKEKSNGRWARIFAERIETEQSEHIVSEGLSGEAMKQIPDELILSFKQ